MLADGGVPFATTIVGIITAFGTLFTAVALIITALAGFRKANKVKEKVDDVHTIVNQQRTDMQRYQAALVHALTQAGITVPLDQSLPIQPEVSGGKH